MKVLTLEGTNFGLIDQMGKALCGYANSDGRTRVKVRYPAAMSASSLRAGRDNLQEVILQLRGEPFEILAHSQGAEAVDEWLEAYEGPSPLQLRRIILIGNPRRRLGGDRTRRDVAGRLRAVPTGESQYLTLDVARRTDKYANSDWWPTPPTSWEKTQAALGMGHSNYTKVDLAKCKTRAVIGNTTYLVSD